MIRLKAWHKIEKRWADHNELISEIPVSASVRGMELVFGSEEWEIHAVEEEKLLQEASDKMNMYHGTHESKELDAIDAYLERKEL